MPGRGIVYVSLIFLYLGYSLYLPLPAGVNHPWKLRICTWGIDAVFLISGLVEKLSGKPVADTLYAMVAMSASPVYHKYADLQVDNLIWDGTPVRVYKPKSLSGLSPAVVYYHGGGWVLNTIEVYEPVLIKMAFDANVIVVAVRYAPKHPYPMPFEDSLKAATYLLKNGKSFGVDVKRVALMGDSAGGNLAAAVSLKLSHEGEDSAKSKKIPPPKLQVLICPVLQALTFNTTSMVENSNWFLKRNWMLFFWAAYLGLDLNSETYSSIAQDAHVSPMVHRSTQGSYLNKIRGDATGNQNKINNNYNKKLASKLDSVVIDPYVSPLMADDLSKVPPALAIAFQFDMLRDEATLYAERLQNAGVKTDLWVIKGESHLSMIFQGYPDLLDNTPNDELFGNITKYIKTSL